MPSRLCANTALYGGCGSQYAAYAGAIPGEDAATTPYHDAMELSDFDDIHSHSRLGPRIITNLYPGDTITTPYGEAWYSVGIHPWHSGEADENIFRDLERMASDSRVIAIGEAGLDAGRGPAEAVQEEVFLRQARLAEDLGKPLIIHCVGRFGRLMELHKTFAPKQRWIVHGFQRKPELARQLVAAGFDISLGERFNPDVVAAVPPNKLFRETD